MKPSLPPVMIWPRKISIEKIDPLKYEKKKHLKVDKGEWY